MEQVGWLSSDFLASREAHLDPILSDFNLNKKPVNLSQHMARVAGDNVYCCTALGSIDKYAFFLKKKNYYYSTTAMTRKADAFCTAS